MRLTTHRNLFNADVNTMFYHPGMLQPEGGRYSKKAIHRYVDLIADSGADTFINNVNAQHPWFPSKRVPNVLDGYTRDDLEFFRGHAEGADLRSQEEWDHYVPSLARFLNLYLDLAEAGEDWVAETALQCRRRGLSPWLSIRMNDLHGANSPNTSYMNSPVYRDPANRFASRVFAGMEAFNYQKQAVRDFFYAMIEEVVEDYDYEGLELDWWRCPIAVPESATQQDIDMMLDWTAELRALTQRRAKETGRPYPLGLRLPYNFDRLRCMGLDVPEMARRDLIDFVGFTNFWQTSWDVPYDKVREELGENVTLYGITDDAPNGTEAWRPENGQRSFRLTSTSKPMLYGNAAGKLALGVDGIEQFNFFCTGKALKIPLHADCFEDMEATDSTVEELHLTGSAPKADHVETRCDYAALQGIGDLENLRGEPKMYAFSSMDFPYDLPYFETDPQVPFILEPRWRRALRLPMFAEPSDRGLELILQVVFNKKEATPEIEVSFNGCWPRTDGELTDQLLFPAGPLTHHVPEHQALNYHFDVSAIREGWNDIIVYNPGELNLPDEERGAKSIRIVSVELGVRKK